MSKRVGIKNRTFRLRHALSSDPVPDGWRRSAVPGWHGTQGRVIHWVEEGFRLHTGPRIIDLAPFDGSGRQAFLDGAGSTMLSRDRRYCTQENIDAVAARCGEMRLQSVWVNSLGRLAHLGVTNDQYCLMRAVGWVWRTDNVAEYRKMMRSRPTRDEWSEPEAFCEPGFVNSAAALQFMERHFGRAAQ